MRALRQWAKSASPHLPMMPTQSSSHDKQNQEIEYVLDDDGRVLATSSLVAPDPWEVEPSAKYPGHFYFFNTITSEATWSLDLDLFKNPNNNNDKDSSQTISPCADEQKHFHKVNLEIVQSGQKKPLKPGRGPRSKLSLNLRVVDAGLGEMSKLPTPDGFNLNYDNAILNNLGTSLDGLVLTVGRSSRASSESLASDFSASFKQPRTYPMPFADGTPSVEVLAGLGAGGYACVCLVKPAHRSFSDKELMAMKVVSKVRNKRPKDKKRLQRELKLMRDVEPSRFLLRCHAAFESSTDVFFVCDYMPGGDLFSYMVERIQGGEGPFPEDQAKNVLAEVTLGLVHLHDRGFIHRDLKVENIMLDASGHVKIIDFGLAVEITSSTGQAMSPTGSLSYMPPELVKRGEKSGGRHTDWWAMGVLAYELMTGRAPWSSLSDKVVIRHEIQNCKVCSPLALSPTARHFIESLLEIDFHRRLGFEDDDDVKKAVFFGSVDWSSVERGDTPAPIKLDLLGPDVVSDADSKNAIATYKNKMEGPASWFFSEEGKFGVKSPFFMGVDVITSHPQISAENSAGRTRR